MNLSDVIAGGVKPYLEYAWVCAPNATAQSISANTITTLTLDTEVADTGGHGSIASNQVTLAAGTYAFKASLSYASWAAPYSIFSLYNVTAGAYVTRRGPIACGNSFFFSSHVMNGQFTISGSTVFELRVLNNEASYVRNGVYTTALTTSTAGLDQRTTLKLWKLA